MPDIQRLRSWTCCLLLVAPAGCAAPASSSRVSDAAVLAPPGSVTRRPAPRAAPVESEEPERALDDTSSLPDYLAYAALNNPGLKAAFHEWQAARERAPQARTLPDPRFAYRYYIQEVETRVGPMEQGVGLSQTLPWFGKLDAAGDAAAEAANAARMRYEAAKLALFEEVVAAYTEYAYVHRAIEIVEDNLDLIAYLENVARARYKTDAAGHPDVIRAQVELGRLEDQLHRLQDLRTPIAARLNAALNRSTTAPLPASRAAPDQQMAADDAEVLAWVAQHNPELAALDYQIARAQHEITLARKAYFPDVTIGVDYTDVGTPARGAPAGFGNAAALRSVSRIGAGAGDVIDAYAIGRSFTPGDRADEAGKDIWIASLSLNLPIWRDKYAAGEREAVARKLAATSRKQQRANDLRAAAQRMLYEYRDAQRRITLYRDTLIPKARESIQSTETAFRAGTATFLELVDAERSLLEFELAYARARADRAQHLATLDRLAGRTVPRAVEPTTAAATSNPDAPGPEVSP